MNTIIITGALVRAERRLAECRRNKPKMRSRAWNESYIHRYEWHVEWRDHGRELLAAYRDGNNDD